MGSVSMRAPPAPPPEELLSPGVPSWHPRQTAPISSHNQPTVLIVGAQDGFLTPLTEALNRHGIFVESTGTVDVMQAVIAGAPDLILLADDAAQDRGTRVISCLASSPLSSVIPVAILNDEDGLEARLQAFRHGVTALVKRTASVDAIATDVARLIREIPERTTLGLGDIGEVTLEELVATLAQELRSGILSVRAKGAEGQEPVRLVLGGGRPVSAIIDEFVQRMGTHILSAEPLEYEFDERAGGTVQLFGRDSLLPEPPREEVDEVRVLLADNDTGRADAVAQELRRRGATVVVTDLEPNEQRFARLRELDPMLLVLGEDQIQGEGYYLVQRLRGDLRLRWASLLVVDWQKIWPEHAATPEMDSLFAGLHALSEPERSIRTWIQGSPQIELRLEATGPARLLRALVAAGQAVRATIHHARALVHVDVRDGLIVGAKADTLGIAPGTVEGARALSALLVMTTGRVRVEHANQPAATNLMATPDVALDMASAESPPITPSFPAPPMTQEDVAGRNRPRFARWPLVLVALGFLLGTGGLAVLAARVIGSVPGEADEVDTSISASVPQPRTSPAAASATPRPSAPAPEPTPSLAAPSGESDASTASAKCREIVAGFAGGGIGVELRNANTAMLRGDLPVARQWYCVAVDRYPEDAAALTGLVRLLMLEGESESALYYAQKAVDAKPGDERQLALLGDAQALTGDYEAARKTFCLAAAIDPNDEGAVGTVERRYRALAYGALDEKRYGEGVRFFRRAVTLNENSLEALIGLSRALLMNGDKAEALTWAEKAVARAPGSVNALVVLGDVLDRSGDRVGAVRAWKKALDLAPGDAEARFRLLKVQQSQ